MKAVTRIPRIAIALTTAFLLLFAGAALTACGGPDHEQAIRDALTQELDEIKNVDDAYIEELTAESGIDELADMGIDPAEFFRSFLSGFDYTIDSVEVDGETATATVTLTMKSFTEFSSTLESEVSEMLQDESILSMSEDEIYQALGDRIMSSLDSMQVSQMDPITVNYELVDNTWTPTSDSMSTIESAMLNH